MRRNDTGSVNLPVYYTLFAGIIFMVLLYAAVNLYIKAKT